MAIAGAHEAGTIAALAVSHAARSRVRVPGSHAGAALQPVPIPRLEPMTLRRFAVLASLLCLATAAPTVAAPAGPASKAKVAPKAQAAACPDSIRLGGQRYAYYQQRVNCRRARRAVKRLYASRGGRGRPRGFRCRSESSFRSNGGCVTPNRKRYFGYSR